MNKLKVLAAAAAIAVAGGVGLNAANAQQSGPAQSDPQQPRVPMAMVCSTTNYTDVVAKALGMTDTDLRVALVGGKTIAQLATSHNVTMQSVEDAVTTARKADLDQALKDGLITQAEHDDAVTRLTNAASNSANAPELRVPDRNVVDVETVASQAIGISCADLVKATRNNETIAQVASDHNVQAQTVIDALTAAFKSALAEDVKEGLITQAESDGELAHLQTAIPQMIYSARSGNGDRPGFGPGNGNGPGFFGGPGGGFPGGRGNQGNQPGQPPSAPSQQGTPPAPPTQAGASS